MISISVLSLIMPMAVVGLLAMLTAYFAAGVWMGTSETYKMGFTERLLLPIFTLPFHLAYGAGTIAGVTHLLRNPACAPDLRKSAPIYSPPKLTPNGLRHPIRPFRGPIVCSDACGP